MNLITLISQRIIFIHIFLFLLLEKTIKILFVIKIEYKVQFQVQNRKWNTLEVC